MADFGTWRDLSDANFPAYDAAPNEPSADHRTEAERDYDRARALADLIVDQGSLFSLRLFEPMTTTLKELLDYTEQQEALTARFVAHGRKRRSELERLIAAADNDLSMTWHQALVRLDPDADAAIASRGCPPSRTAPLLDTPEQGCRSLTVSRTRQHAPRP